MMKIDDQRKAGTDTKRTCRSYGAWVCFGWQQTIKMALLTELFHVAARRVLAKLPREALGARHLCRFTKRICRRVWVRIGRSRHWVEWSGI